MRRLARLKEEIRAWRSLQEEARSLQELAEMAEAEEETSLEEALRRDLEALWARLDALEFRRLLSGPYDERDAILAVHAGAGGTEAHDWAQMLLRMYLRWAERKGFRTRILDLSEGEEAGIKSATVEVAGPYAYGHLKGEKGVHRLVRLSPFDADHQRHTSFALVEVLPEVEEVEVHLRPEDLRFDYFRASGHGGQHVQKNATAVRVVHLPTGITVVCQNERSQLQNKETALKILRARLMERALRERAEQLARLKGEHRPAEWGHQIRSYILHPYKLVKDHRTGYETGDPEGVLDGELDPLLRAYLLTQAAEEGTGSR